MSTPNPASNNSSVDSSKEITNLITAAGNEIEQCSINWNLQNEYTRFKKSIQNEASSRTYTGVQKDILINAIKLMNKQIINKFCSIDKTFAYLENLVEMPESIKKTTDRINNYLDYNDISKPWTSVMSNQQLLSIVIICLLVIIMLIVLIK